jgi:hypothetical protein
MLEEVTVGVSEELLLPESVEDELFWRGWVSGRGCAAAVCSWRNFEASIAVVWEVGGDRVTVPEEPGGRSGKVPRSTRVLSR